MYKKLTFLLIFNSLIFNTLAQEKKPYSRKGEYYFFWGFNRSDYTKSDITFRGKGYDFTLHDVVANDLPSHCNVKLPFDFYPERDRK